MGGINTGRWIAGGVVAGVIVWLLEGAASLLYMEDMEAALAAHNLASVEMSISMVLLTVCISLISGLVLIFLYAAARPRFGPGPKTAVIAALTLWTGGMLLSILGYSMVGLYETSMLVMWGIIGLVELIVAALAGGWIYREPDAPAA
jgi:hypothetical protein